MVYRSIGLATSVGDEGGFAPDLASDEEAIEYILEAVRQAGYEPGRDFVLAMDAASSEWKGSQKGEYVLPKCGKKFTSAELVEHWKSLVEKYPIYSIEDGLDEEDWEGWQILTKELGPVCDKYRETEKRNRYGMRQLYPDQIKSDWFCVRDA